MPIDKEYIRAAITDFFRLMNKIGKLEKQPLDFGTGDLLYPVEIHTIDEIGKKKGETVTDLCRLFGVTKGAVSQIIGKLYRKGYVAKMRNENDGKEILLSLTEKGKKAFSFHVAMHNAMDGELMDNFADRDSGQISQFRENLGRIEAHVDKYLKMQKGE